ncbi:MAG: hypothetical protein AAFW87_04570 [Pseudomonadota bacterium]
MHAFEIGPNATGALRLTVLPLVPWKRSARPHAANANTIAIAKTCFMRVVLLCPFVVAAVSRVCPVLAAPFQYAGYCPIPKAFSIHMINDGGVPVVN